MATAERLNVLLTADARDLENKLRGASRSIEAFGQRMTRVGRDLTLRVSAPLAAIGGAAIKLASDAVESENLFEVAMGGMADSARAFSEELRSELGLNAYEVRRQIGTFNQMFTAMGIGTDRAYEMATGLAELTNDMASFFNLNPADAFQKLQSGIAGEIEPLRRLGILVDEQTVKQIALRKGLIQSGQELTQQQKVWLRYVAILDQTTNAQGDLARTLDSPANQFRRLRTSVEELLIRLGRDLLPTVQNVLKSLLTWLDRLKGLSAGTRAMILRVAGLVIALGPLLSIVGRLAKAYGVLTRAAAAFVATQTVSDLLSLARAFTTAGAAAKSAQVHIARALAVSALRAGAIGATVLALGALAHAFYENARQARELRRELEALRRPIDVDIAEQINRGIGTLSTDALRDLRNQISHELERVQQNAARLREQLGAEVFDRAALSGSIDGPFAEVRRVTDDVLALGIALRRVNEEIKARPTGGIVPPDLTVPGIDPEAIRTISDVLGELPSRMAAAAGAAGTLEGPLEALRARATVLRTTVEEAFDIDAEAAATNADVQQIAAEYQRLQTILDNLAGIKLPDLDFGSKAADGVEKSLDEGLAAGQPFVSAFQSLGSSLINGIINGMESGEQLLKSFFSTLLNGLLRVGLLSLGIFSPSRVTTAWGEQLLAGFAVGFRSGRSSLDRAWQSVLGAFTQPDNLQPVRQQIEYTRAAIPPAPDFDVLVQRIEMVRGSVPEAPALVPVTQKIAYELDRLPQLPDLKPITQTISLAYGRVPLPPDLLQPAAVPASPVAAAAPIQQQIVVDLSGVTLFGDPAGEARKIGSQVFLREGMTVAKESGF